MSCVETMAGRKQLVLQTAICLAVAHGFAVAAVQDFGQVSVAGSRQSQVLTYSFTGISGVPSFSLGWGRDFQAGAPTCSVGATTNCSVTVQFSPIRPGLRQDALNVKSQAGTVLASTPLTGIGLAPLMVLQPGVISTLAGNGSWGYLDSSTPGAAMFRNPQGIAADGEGNIYVADSGNGAIRKITLTSGAVTTVAGTGSDGFAGDGGLATNALLNAPTGVALDGAGNFFIADQGNNLIRRVDAITKIISTVAGGGTVASGADQLGDGGPATSAILYGPQGIAVDQNGNLYIADCFDNVVRVVNASSGVITILAGGGTAAGNDGFGDGGVATGALLSNPAGVALDSAGNVYIADAGNNLIRRVDRESGIITAVVGTGNSGYSGDGGLATAATLSSPQGLWLDAANNVYIADFGNSAIRRVGASNQTISTVAGSGNTGYSGDGGDPTLAMLANPASVAVAENGDLYIADYANNVIRRVSYITPTLAFSSEAVGGASPAQITSAMNIGNEEITFSAITISSSFSQGTGGAPNCAVGSILAPGSTCGAAVTFAPVTVGAISGSLTLTTNSLNQAAFQTVSLSGIGLPGRPAAVTLSATSLSFGPQLVGSATAQTLTLSNNGGSGLSVSSVSITGAEASDFQISNMCGATLAAGAGCTISLTFTPSAAGARTASLQIADSATGSPQTVVLSGMGVIPPTATLSATSLSFGPQLVGSATAQTLTLSNNGGSGLSVSSVSITGAQASDFQIGNMCGATLAAGAGCTISLTFTPSAAGARTASLQIADSATGSPQTVVLSGMGVIPPTATLSATSLSFGPQLVGSATAQTLTLSNNGGSGLSVSSVSITGAQASDFQISNMCGATLAAGAGCTISLTFTPSAAGARTASLRIADSATGSPQTVVLSGMGVIPPTATLSATSLSFGPQLVGSATAQTLTLSNNGGSGLSVSSVSITGAEASDFQISNMCGATLAAGAGCTISLTFTPSAVGARSATLLIADPSRGLLTDGCAHGHRQRRDSADPHPLCDIAELWPAVSGLGHRANPHAIQQRRQRLERLQHLARRHAGGRFSIQQHMRADFASRRQLHDLADVHPFGGRRSQRNPATHRPSRGLLTDGCAHGHRQRRDSAGSRFRHNNTNVWKPTVPHNQCYANRDITECGRQPPDNF